MPVGDWRPVIQEHACDICLTCGEGLICPRCHTHFPNCGCPQADRPDLYHYALLDGVPWGKARKDVCISLSKKNCDIGLE